MAAVGDVRAFAFSFVPQGWKECDGQTLSRKDYALLFNLIQFTYGGDGVRNFAVPDLRGRTAIGAGSTPASRWQNGNFMGTETETLTIDQMPPHTHNIHGVRGTAGLRAPRVGGTIGRLVAQGTVKNGFVPSAGGQLVKMHADMTGPGDDCAGRPHENRQPYLAVTYGIYTGQLR